MGKRILVIEDEVSIQNILRIFLEDAGYQVTLADDGMDGIAAFHKDSFDLVLLDIMMPEMDGMEAMVKIRERSNVPIILLTAKSEDSDKILGLTVGADDYITKPFHPVEVSARVKSQLRRYMLLGAGNIRPEVLRCGGIEMDDTCKKVLLDGEEVALTPTEYDILKLLMTHPGQVFSPKEIYRKIWNDLPYGSENTVAVHIRHLREKLEINPSDPRYLKVVWGLGYKIEKGA